MPGGARVARAGPIAPTKQVAKGGQNVPFSLCVVDGILRFARARPWRTHHDDHADLMDRNGGRIEITGYCTVSERPLVVIKIFSAITGALRRWSKDTRNLKCPIL